MSASQIGIIIDAVFAALLAAATFIGLKNGLVKQIFGFGSKIVALLAAVLFASKVGAIINTKWIGGIVAEKVSAKISEIAAEHGATIEAMENELGGLLKFFKIEVQSTGGDLVSTYSTAISEKLSTIISNAIAFVGLFLVVWCAMMLLGLILRPIFKLPVLKAVDKIGGAVLGLVSGVITCLIISSLLPSVMQMAFPNVEFAIEYSRIGNFLTNLHLVEWVKEKIFRIDFEKITEKVELLTSASGV